MNDDERLDRAIRGALGDVVAAAPDRDDVPVRPAHVRADRGRRGPWLTVAAGLTAAAGIVAVLVVTTRSTITTDVTSRSAPAGSTTPVAPASTAAPATSSSSPASTTSTSSTSSSTSTSMPASTTTVAQTPGPRQRVEFRRGTNNTSVADEVVAGTTDRYVLEASAEQRMIVNVDAAVPDITFSILAPDGTPLAENEVLAAVELPVDGDYVVEVRTNGGGGAYEIDFLIN
jgi:negative regulator of sigma E activity